MELNNGCLCCTLNEGLYEILQDLYHKRNTFEELIIEATGVADPRGLAAPFITNPPVKKQFPLRQVICLIDVSLIEQQLEETEEAVHQITYSDILLVNKMDLVDGQTITRVRQLLNQLNPFAKVYLGAYDQLPDLHNMSPRVKENLILQADNDEVTVFEEMPPPNHKHTKGIKSISITFDKPFDLHTLQFRLKVFLSFQSKGLYRMKGILWIKKSDEKYYLQSVGKQISIDKLKAWEPNKKRKSTIVMIGVGLQKSGLQKMFNQCI